MSDFQLLINGQLEAGDATMDVINPATGESFAQAPRASKAQLDKAVAAAKAAFPGWAATPIADRKAALTACADAIQANLQELARLLTQEQGKPIGDAMGEVLSLIHILAVLTHRFWTERLGADPAVVGRTLRLNAHDFTVVGVAAPGFEGASLAGTDLWVPMAMVAEARGLANANLLTSPRATWHVALGRLKPGVTRATAAAELRTLMAQYIAATPDANPRHSASLVPDVYKRQSRRRPCSA